MDQFFTVIIYLSCQLVPQGIQTFDLAVSRLDKSEEIVLHYTYLEKEQAWESAPILDKDDKALFAVEGDKLKVLLPSEEVIDMGAYMQIDPDIDWASIKELPFKEAYRRDNISQGPIKILRELDQKRIRYWQEEGALTMFEKFEIRWE